MPRLRVIRDDECDDTGRPIVTVRELERSVLDLAQDVAATCSMSEGIGPGVTEQAVLALCDAVNDLNATIVGQGCPPGVVRQTGNPGA
jgi:hypothetical protein